MKKISSFLLAGLFTASITACSQETINVPLQTTQPTNNVSTYSAEGLKSILNNMLQLTFKEFFDKNKDNFVSLEEYKLAFSPSPLPPLPPSEPVEPPSEQPVPAPDTQTPEQLVNQISAQSKKMNIPIDPVERFKKMDKNKDGKLSLTEAKNNTSYFMAYDKNSIRTAARGAFESMDKNKNKSISRDEFTVANAVGADTNSNGAQILQGMLFMSADKNNNKSLNFSEFEDVYYNAFKTMYYPDVTIPKPPATDPVVPPSEQPVPAPEQP